jgi:hypothetical protein
LATKTKWWPDSIIGRVAVVVVLFGIAYFALFLLDLIFLILGSPLGLLEVDLRRRPQRFNRRLSERAVLGLQPSP